MKAPDIEALLNRWGEWCRKGAAGASGYPAQTVLGKFQRDGIPPTRNPGGTPAPLPVDLEAEQVEKAIARLRQIQAQWADALTLTYVYSQPQPMVAREMRSSPAAVKDWLFRGRAYVLGVVVNC